MPLKSLDYLACSEAVKEDTSVSFVVGRYFQTSKLLNFLFAVFGAVICHYRCLGIAVAFGGYMLLLGIVYFVHFFLF